MRPLCQLNAQQYPTAALAASLGPQGDRLNFALPAGAAAGYYSVNARTGGGVASGNNARLKIEPSQKTREGVLEGKDFADALFSVWLGANPVQEDLKRALLKG